MRLQNEKNRYGTEVAVFICDTCGDQYTVCPVPANPDNWHECLSAQCDSYDPDRDVDSMFDKDDRRIEKRSIARIH